MIDTQPTQAEARKTLKRFGYQLRHLDGEFEVYPTGQRGPRSYFTDDLADAIATARTTCNLQFAKALSVLNVDGQLALALQQWHDVHQIAWKDKLFAAWYSGSYGSTFADASGQLQRLRNYGAGEADNGHEFVAHLELILAQLS